MNLTAILTALTAVFLIKTVSGSDGLFVESSTNPTSLMDAHKDQVKNQNHSRPTETRLYPDSYNGEQILSIESPIETLKLKTNNELEIEQPFSLARNGKLIFVNQVYRSIDLCTISPGIDDEPRPMHINENDLIKGKDQGRTVTFMAPKFSPDGSKITFSRSGKKISGSTIYVMDQDGQNLKEITDGRNPCFTPDGQKIVFISNLNQVFTCDLNGEDKRKLIPKIPNAHFLEIVGGINFTPDGNGIYFIQFDFSTNSYDLKIVDAATGEIIKIVNGVEKASFSPDGKYIVFINFFDWSMRIMDVESGKIFEDLPFGRFMDVIWSPDGSKIFYRLIGYCGLYDIKFVDGRPVLETIRESRISGADDFAWQSLPI